MSFEPQERGHPTLTGGLLESETELRELSAEFVFAVPVSTMLGFLSLFVTSPALGFLHVQLPWLELLQSLSSAVLGFCLTRAELRLLNPKKVKSKSWHHICLQNV